MQKKKGISLIVLVITIIVMIILAAAIILSLNNSGIIGKANKAVNDTNDQEVNQIAQLAWGEAYLNGKRTEQELREAVITSLTNNGIDTSKYVIEVTTKGVTVTRGQGTSTATTGWIQDRFTITKGDVTLEAGDLIQYDAGIQGYEGSWKVLGAEGGNLLIMATEDVDTLRLIGAEGGEYNSYTSQYGYLNGVDRINEICSLYGNGTGAVATRSITMDDINKLTLFNPNEYRNGETVEYNNTFELYWPEDYSPYYTEHNNNKKRIAYTDSNENTGYMHIYSNSTEYFKYIDFNNNRLVLIPLSSTNGQLPKIRINYYTYNKSDITVESKYQKAIDMIFNDNSNYYTTTRFVSADHSGGPNPDVKQFIYGYFCINPIYIEAGSLIYSFSNDASLNRGIRPVIKLSPNIKIGSKDNTFGWSYTI